MSSKKRVVVTGLGVVSCLGQEVNQFYDHLLAGKSGIKNITRFDTAEFATRFAGEVSDFNVEGYIEKKQARRIDLANAYSIVAGKKALEQAGFSRDAIQPDQRARYGVLIGSGLGGMTTFAGGVLELFTKGPRRISPFFVPFSITNMSGALLSIDLGFQGPNYSISTACASANYAIIAAANHIRHGDADLFICGGTEAPIIPSGVCGFNACKALSTLNENPQKAARPWDKNRDGFVIAEGAGVLVLESLEHAQKRGATILAEYLGGGISCDAHHMTEPCPDGSGVAACLQNALLDAKINIDQINYVNAHATCTPVGDLAEIKAMKQIFKNPSQFKMNATKSMIGHSLGAAAGLEAVVLVKAIQTGKLHPTINMEDPEEIIQEFDVVQDVAQDCQVEVGISNSFGFGGHNSSIVMAPFS